MLDDNATKLIEEALTMEEEQGIAYLIDHIQELPENVRTQLALSVIGNAFQDEADRKKRASEFLESVKDVAQQMGI